RTFWQTDRSPTLPGVTIPSPESAPVPAPPAGPPSAAGPAAAPAGLPDGGLVASLRGLDRNGRLLFAMRTLRMFGYGFLAVVLVLYRAAVGLDPLAVGIVLTLTLI